MKNKKPNMIYITFTILMNGMIASITGWGMFWWYRVFSTNNWGILFEMYIGMFVSAIMMFMLILNKFEYKK